MKEKSLISKNEKCFGFFKMDKKNVQILKARIFYAKSVNCDDKKILACHYKKNNFQFVTINFRFYIWTFLGLSMVWQCLAIFSIAKIAKIYKIILLIHLTL
jgi:hypothetical protein